MRRGGREGAAAAAPFFVPRWPANSAGLYTQRRKTQDKERRKMTLDTKKFELSRKDAQRVVGEWVRQFSV